MKKSEIYEAVQISVMNDDSIVNPKIKLAILAELMSRAEIERILEKEEEKKNAET